MEPAFDKVDGVISTTSGYTGGRTKNLTYEQVKTGHIESIQIRFDPDRVPYDSLASLFCTTLIQHRRMVNSVTRATSNVR